MGYISTRMHGPADYAVGVLLIIAPYIFGFATGGIEQWLPMLLGFAVIVYSMLTRYEWGLLPIIRMPVHIGLDVAGGLLLAISPWLFGFADQVWVPHLIIGLIEIGAAAATSTRPELIQAPYVAGNETMATGMTVGIAAVLAIVVGSAIMFTDGTDMMAGQEQASTMGEGAEDTYGVTSEQTE
jgi:hypothetical protein